MFIRVFEQNLTGIIEERSEVFTKNSKNITTHFAFNGTAFEDIKLFQETLLIKKIPKNQIAAIDGLPFYSVLFNNNNVFIFQPMSACYVLVQEDQDVVRKDVTSLTVGDSVVFYDNDFKDFYIEDVEEISVFDTVDEQFMEDEEDMGFSGYVVGAENPNGLILNNLLLI